MSAISSQYRFSQKLLIRRAAGHLRRSERWAVILAGGDGTRLQSMTRSITGDDRPKHATPCVDAEFIVKVPQGLKEVGVLLEPTTVVEKGIAQAFEIQRRLRVWKPKRAAVMGTGTIGLLATLVLRLKGLQVVTFGKTPKPYLNSDLIEAIGATYQSTDELSILEGAKKYGPFDIIFEATGFSPVVFESMQALGKNGVLVLSSVTGGDRKVEVPADKINLEFVLGNKVMVGTVNANREYFEMGVKDLAQAEAEYPAWLSRLLTDPVKGLENYRELFAKLTNPNGAIKVCCEVAELN
jgi:threonine dehydrogenase-like Zn-dependent dehydrogenase